ncbi:MAG: hypothetical protein U9O65_03140 [Thermotogota bacterium]|nr:hypothetical protein [Thermotogota bacterium]
MKIYRWINCPEEASFINSPNRFTAIVKGKSFEKLVYLPDHGRLERLLIPNVNVIMRKEEKQAKHTMLFFL